jgi:DNA-binding transcriptional MocR family regulator
LTPLALLAPERTFFVTGLSKALAPGLRVGMLTAPQDRHGAALDAMRAVAFGSPSIGALVAVQWMEDGTADAIFTAVKAETDARCALVRDRLGDRVAPSRLSALPHLWMPMDELTAERVAGQALRAGVELTPPRAQVVDGAPVRGLRVCVGGPRSLAETERGVEIIAAALAQPEATRDAV